MLHCTDITRVFVMSLTVTQTAETTDGMQSCNVQHSCHLKLHNGSVVPQRQNVTKEMPSAIIYIKKTFSQAPSADCCNQYT